MSMLPVHNCSACGSNLLALGGLTCRECSLRQLAVLKEGVEELESMLSRVDLGASNHNAYLSHGLLCSGERGIGACDCGYSEIEKACRRSFLASEEVSRE